MKIDLIPERTCSVRNGSVSIDGFRVESEWHGFVRLVHKEHGELIVTRDRGRFADIFEVFETIFGKGDLAREAVIVAGTPDLIDKLRKGSVAQEAATAA